MRPGMSALPFTTPLHGNTVQVSSEDTGQNIYIPKWYNGPYFPLEQVDERKKSLSVA